MSCFSLKSHEIPRTALPRQVLALNVLWMAIELELEGTAAGDLTMGFHQFFFKTMLSHGNMMVNHGFNGKIIELNGGEL